MATHTWDAIDKYFSGQGVVMVAARSAAGQPMGFYAIGNVSDLKLSIAVTNLEHKESHTGQRATDLRIPQETKGAFSMTMENFSVANLARGSRGTATTVVAGAETVQPIKAYPGRVTGLGKMKVSAVVITQDAVVLTEYTDATTPYDYKVNQEAGSVEFNDGSLLARDGLGIEPTGVTVGATTTITVANDCVVGDLVTLTGFAGADAATLNGKTVPCITGTDGTKIVVAIDSTAGTIAFAGARVNWDGMAMTVAYSYEAQYDVQALTQGIEEFYLRFEGLNTADSNEPVVVEVFKASADPFKELALIADQVQSFVLEGSILADNTRATGSKFFSVQHT